MAYTCETLHQTTPFDCSAFECNKPYSVCSIEVVNDFYRNRTYNHERRDHQRNWTQDRNQRPQRGNSNSNRMGLANGKANGLRGGPIQRFLSKKLRFFFKKGGGSIKIVFKRMRFREDF